MNAAPPRILVAGIGNIFLGDDAFGCEVTQQLLRRPQPANVRVVDFGIRSLDLVYALADSYDAAILIDAAPRPGGSPGSLYVLEPIVDSADSPTPLEGHSMDPVQVLRAAASMGATLQRVLIVGCEPLHTISQDDAEVPLGLSDVVAAAIEPAVAKVESLIQELSNNLLEVPS